MFGVVNLWIWPWLASFFLQFRPRQIMQKFRKSLYPPPPPLPLSSSCPPTPTAPLLSPPTILFLHGRAVWDTHADILHEMCRNFAHQKSRHMLNLSDNRPTKAGHRNVNVREKIAQYFANANYIFLVHTVCTKQDILYSPPISNCNIQGRLAISVDK